MTTVHLHCEIDGRWCVACMPGGSQVVNTVAHMNTQMSGDPRAVTCALCKKTQFCREVEIKLGIAPAPGGRR